MNTQSRGRSWWEEAGLWVLVFGIFAVAGIMTRSERESRERLVPDLSKPGSLVIWREPGLDWCGKIVGSGRVLVGRSSAAAVQEQLEASERYAISTNKP